MRTVNQPASCFNAYQNNYSTVSTLSGTELKQLNAWARNQLDRFQLHEIKNRLLLYL